MADTRVPTPAHRVASRMIGGQALILDPNDDVMRRLNSVGSFIWALVQKGESTVDELVGAVTTEFEIEAPQARTDIEAFLGQLDVQKLVTWR